jgi:hypothetical protein
MDNGIDSGVESSLVCFCASPLLTQSWKMRKKSRQSLTWETERGRVIQMTIYELDKMATPGPFEAVVHLGRAQVIRGGNGGWIAEFDHVPDYDKSAADARLLAHCRNNFMRALEALKTSNIAMKKGRMPGPWTMLIAELEEVK